jgi:UDP-2-acetamido-3-amino-2,3-dideoxy-glucuronate N-acetyltransferase
VVNKNVKPFALIVGVPGKQIGWMSEYGEKLDLPISGNAQTVCKRSLKKYQLKDSKVSVII